jgi:4-hydroxybenzoate polyprenyltransferase
VSVAGKEGEIPLCVSCEHALLKTNIFNEAIFLLVKRNLLNVFLLPIWFLRGRSELIRQVSEKIKINWRTVPVHEGVVERIRAAHGDNRPVFLLTSMPQTWAHELCAEFDCSKAIVIDKNVAKTPAGDTGSPLTDLFGGRGFDYIGSGRRDLLLCQSARRVLIVSSNRSAITRAKRNWSVESVITGDRAGPFTFLKMIRVHQWTKNCLVWVPILAAHRLTSLRSIGIAAVVFMAFSLCASSGYVLNDLLDLESDREHVRKRNRPIAAGKIAVKQALIIALLLFVTAAWLAFRVSALFALTVGIYFVTTMAYSLRLKRQVIVDVMLLAALYTIRILAGAVATTVVPSFWLLALSMFLFLSLAMVKRYSEMLITLSQDKQHAAGRGYSVEDLPVLLSLGVSAGIAAIVVLALYINDPSTNKMYPSTIWLWPVPPLMLYWVSRVWMKAHRGEMHDDPVVFAMRDWQSLVTVVLGGLCFTLAAI